jgi:PAS domain S-box-containing protein
MPIALPTIEKPLWGQTKCLWPKRCRQCEDREHCPIQHLVQENELLKEEIRVSRESAEITAALVVKQFEETERVLRRFQVANAQRKAVLDSAAHLAIMATEETGTITVFNKGAENLLGYHASEVIGQMTPVVFHVREELKSKAKDLSLDLGRSLDTVDLFFHLAAHEMDETQEWTYVHKNGTHFSVNLSIDPLRDAGGAISGFLCIAADITEKKRSEQALKESERNYRLLIDNIPNIVFKGYSDGTIDFFDDKIEALTGYSKEEFLSRKITWNDLVYEDDRPGRRLQILKALKGDHQYIREYRIRRKDGDIVWVQASSQIVCDADGRIEFITGAMLDITKRKTAEAALHDSEEKYRSLFNSGPNPIFVLDSKTLNIIDVNPAAIDAYGYSKEEMIGQPFGRLGEFEIQEQGLEPEAAVDWPNGCFINQKARHHKKDGTPFYIRVKACPTKYKEQPALILAATDITEAIEKDAQLFQATKMQTLGEMSAGMAHELTQPLNAIKIGNDYFRRMIEQGKQPSPEELERVALAVTEQVRRASDIINRLREFGRKPEFQKELVDLNAVISSVLDIIGHQLLLINIHVDIDLDDTLPPILANFNRIEQVLFNLVSNARDAIEQLPVKDRDATSRTIAVSTYTEGNDVVCVVSDTGVGISIDDKDKIFEPFYTTKEVGKGMGLGLSISYGIVQDYGGTIEVDAGKDGGTSITLRFALPQSHESRDTSRPDGD